MPDASFGCDAELASGGQRATSSPGWLPHELPRTNGNPWMGERQPLRAVLAFLLAAAVACACLALSNVLARLHKVLRAEPSSLMERSGTAVVAAAVVVFAYHLLPYVLPPGLPPSDRRAREFQNDPAFLRKIGVVVPAHKAALEIGDVLERMLRYFQPEHIVVVDNANSPSPPDETEAVVARVHPHIRYAYVPEGHKTRALLTGTLALPPAVEYVLHVDDDTRLSDAMVFDESKFSSDARVVALTFGIRMGGNSMCARLVDWEFVQFSIDRTFQAERATAFFCHGIVGLWRREPWLARLLAHPSMPYGEDNWIGCDAMSESQRIGAELRCHVSTFAPPRFLPPLPCEAGAREQGYGASSVWKQRAYRWYTNAPRRVHFRLRQLVLYRAGSASANAWVRLFLVLHLASIFAALSAPFVLAAIAAHGGVRRGVPSLLVGASKLLALRAASSWTKAAVVRVRAPQLAPSLPTALLFPLYSSFLDVALVFGHWRGLLYYQPFWPLRRTMPARWLAAAHGASAKVRPSADCSSSSNDSRSLSSVDSPRPPSPRAPVERGAGARDEAQRAETGGEPPTGWLHMARALASSLVSRSPAALVPAVLMPSMALS